MAPAVSIITPTFNRHALLKAQAAIVAAQTVSDFEWLILDDGPEPCPWFATLSDPRIRYTHLGGAPMLVSAKRNWLCERATAPVIVTPSAPACNAPLQARKFSSPCALQMM